MTSLASSRILRLIASFRSTNLIIFFLKALTDFIATLLSESTFL